MKKKCIFLTLLFLIVFILFSKFKYKNEKEPDTGKQTETSNYEESTQLVAEIKPTIKLAKRIDAKETIPDSYNTGTNGELSDFLTLYPDAYINNNLVYITKKFVEEYGNEISNFVLKDYGIYFKEPIGDFKISNAKFSGNQNLSYAVQLTNDYVKAGNTVTVENCEGSYYNAAFNTGMNFKFVNCYIHDMYQDAFKADTNVSIQNCYVRGCGLSKDSHADGVQVASNTKEEINIEIRNTRFEQPFIAKKYYENSCVFIKLEEEGYGKISLSDLYLNGGNYSFYILQNQDKEYTNMQYEINNIKIGDSARYGKREIKVDIPEQSEIQNVNQLYVTSVFEQDGKVYVSVTNDSMESRTLKIVTEKEEKEFEVDRCWDGTSTEASDNEVQSFDQLFEIDPSEVIRCYEGDTLIGQFQFWEEN